MIGGREGRQAWPLRWHLAVFGAALLLPMIATLGAIGTIAAGAEQARLVDQARETARRIVDEIETLIATNLALLDIGARLLAEDESRTAEAVRERALGRPGLGFVRYGADGRELHPVGPDPCPAPDRLVGQPAPWISGLLRCPDGLGDVVIVAVPLRDGGKLALHLPVERLREPLRRWSDDGAMQGAALADADRVILARGLDHDRFVGHPMPAAARVALEMPSGIWRGRNLAGQPVLVAHATSPLTGWAVGFGMRDDMLARPLREMLYAIVPVGALLALLAGLGTLLLARRIERPIADLAAAAMALGRGEQAVLPRGRIAEVDRLADALLAAAQAQAETEGRRRLLLQEMQHRVKNMLATVQAIALLSARGAEDVREFSHRFGLRLRALADAHALLMASDDSGVRLDRLLARELAPYCGADGAPRARWEGPPVTLPADAAIAFGLVLHELATNAAKHGALSRPEGRLEVTWRREQARAPGRLVLDWIERGGPPVTVSPTRSGFGSRLLAQALGGRLGGSTTLAWRQEGLHARIALPLAAPPRCRGQRPSSGAGS